MNNGISYFPLDVHLDDKFELIEAEFGLTGFAVVVKIFQKIYGGQGYYCEWTNDVALLFSRSVGLGCSAVSEIVRASVRRGIFDKELFDKYSILTSKGIQNRYFEVVNRRKKVEVKKEYLLVQLGSNLKNVCILSENVDIFSKNAYISEQRKGKERKGKESRGKEEQTAANATLVKLISLYEKNIAPMTSIVLDNISDWLNDVEPGVIEYAIKEAVEHDKRNWKYIHAIINNHFNAGRTTLAAVETAKRSYNPKNTEKVFTEGDIDYAAIERQMMGGLS